MRLLPSMMSLTVLALLLCACSGKGPQTPAADSAQGAAHGADPAQAALPTLAQVARQSQPVLPMYSAEPLVQNFAPGEVVLATPRLDVQIDQVSYGPYGMRIEATAQQHVRVTGGGLYVNFGDTGALRDDLGGTYKLRDPDLDLQTRAAAIGGRWKLQLQANGFLPANAQTLDLGLNMSTDLDGQLVHARWPVPAGWAARAQAAGADRVEPGRGWRFGKPPAGNSPRGTASVRVLAVHWLADGIAVELEAINSERASKLQLNSGAWSTRLVDDHNRIYRIVQSDSAHRAIGIGNGQRAAGRLLFAPQIAPDAKRLRLLINGGPKGGDPWAPVTVQDDNALAPVIGIAFDIPPAAMPDQPAATRQEVSLNLAQPPLTETALAVSSIDPIARLKRELDASDRAGATVVDLPGDVLFDFDQATLRADAAPTLDKLAELITRMQRPARITGYTDDKGDAAYNLELSRQRAQAVHDALVGRGVDAVRLTTSGRGEANPKAANRQPDGNDNAAGRQQNRRVEVAIAKG